MPAAIPATAEPGAFTLGDDERGDALPVRTQPTFATFPLPHVTYTVCPTARTGTTFPSEATSVTAPITVTLGVFYTGVVVLSG